MKTTAILIAGFGGQGTLFAGKVLAVASLMKGLEVSWLPSYGPEMRGGTANCSVMISDSPIGSPIVSRPDVLLALNKPSFEKYEKVTVPGGSVFVDSSLVDVRSTRNDIGVYYTPATEMAGNVVGNAALSNIVLIGKVIKETGLFTEEEIIAAITETVPKSKQALLDANIKALRAGMDA
ncbi:MAG: 2-oxoacid:acceptor oxidoreductase family protein [Bacteroidales bacterium]|nr:2-oxoacid:acceptor oxidoreductase family protein [Bacteroidales bacterium]